MHGCVSLLTSLSLLTCFTSSAGHVQLARAACIVFYSLSRTRLRTQPSKVRHLGTEVSAQITGFVPVNNKVAASVHCK